MHAADYPGSHVVIRSRSRQEEVPHQTLLEAAQLAAFYSQGKKQPKAAVHYTLKKFVNKPKGAAPGLVSLSSFKTLLVEPVVPDIERRDLTCLSYPPNFRPPVSTRHLNSPAEPHLRQELRSHRYLHLP
jgi:hypothetical protein